MEINLPPHLKSYADSAIASGAFKDLGQLVNTALEKLKSEDQEKQSELQRIRDEIEDCFTDHPDNNKFYTLEEVKEYFAKKYDLKT